MVTIHELEEYVKEEANEYYVENYNNRELEKLAHDIAISFVPIKFGGLLDLNFASGVLTSKTYHILYELALKTLKASS